MFLILESVFLFLAHLISVSPNHPIKSLSCWIIIKVTVFEMERNLAGVIISSSLVSALDDGKESFDLFVHEDEKWADCEVMMMKGKDVEQVIYLLNNEK